MLISKSRYLSLFNVFFFLDEIFYHFRKRRGPRASGTCADQGPHTVHENVPTFKVGNYKTHEEMSSVVIFICRGYKPLELTGYRIIWLKISGMPLGKKSWSEYFFLLSKPARTIPRFQVNQWKGNLSPFRILLTFNCLFSFLSFFAPKDKVNSFISIVKDCPLNRTGIAFQML